MITQYKWNKFRNTKNQNQEKNKFLNEKRKEKNNNSDSQNNANDVQNNTLPKAFVIGKMLIENFESNFHAKRFKYNPLVYDFAMLMYLTWAKSYDQLRQVFPLPSKISLYKKFGDQLNDIKLDLTDLTRLPNVLRKQ